MENYLLNNKHSEGKSKAKFLKDVLGYKSGDGKILHDNLVKAVLNKKPVKVENTSYGIKNTYKIKLVGKNNKEITANVVCIFQKIQEKQNIGLLQFIQIRGNLMKELDVVRLKEDDKEISKGTKGTIVLIYDDKNCEVDFFDKDGDTIDVVMTPLNKLELIESF